MTTVSSKVFLAALVIGTAVTAAQAGESRWVWPEDKPQPQMVAESGKRLIHDHLQPRQALGNQPAAPASAACA